MTHTEALQMARGALEIGRDCAAEVAQRLHTELAGYRQHKHDAADADAAKIDAAIAALDALQSAQPAQTGGSPEHMLQDHSRELSRWLADKPDARLHAREAAAAIAAQPSAPSAEPADNVLEQCATLVDALRRKLTGTTAKAAASECAMQIRNLRAPTAPAPAQAEPVAWANSASLTSARISRERGGPFDRFNCSEGRTCYHDTPLYAAPPAAAAPPQPLTEAAILRIVQRTIHGSTLLLTRDVGTYEVTEPTHDLCMLVRAIERAHGITPAKEQP